MTEIIKDQEGYSNIAIQNPILMSKQLIIKRKKDKYPAPTRYEVLSNEINSQLKVANIFFQEDNPAEVGINGCVIEDLISICIDRLQYFQESEFRCRENASALTHLEQSLMWLNKRTLERRAKGIEGTNKK